MLFSSLYCGMCRKHVRVVAPCSHFIWARKVPYITRLVISTGSIRCTVRNLLFYAQFHWLTIDVFSTFPSVANNDKFQDNICWLGRFVLQVVVMLY